MVSTNDCFDKCSKVLLVHYFTYLLTYLLACLLSLLPYLLTYLLLSFFLTCGRGILLAERATLVAYGPERARALVIPFCLFVFFVVVVVFFFGGG